ncbi:DUF2167 domain-containing protein [Deinococcus arcticus]|uniref:DUF2167 domain-containing protein n=1 Tax=Deinococcus arcticus TaxID=2136176 RepID=A0A2T3W5G7_9DEIO|nr:DUF2167 domain-containing protein [Deinococcus arcticus]PTA67119.1 DUF2167 domain-containing protein [Deinococcus arcticus]
MMKKTLMLLVLGGLSLAGAQSAQTPTEAPLRYQTGQIALLGGKAQLSTGAGLRYLDAAGAREVIVGQWGNPPEAAEDVLGMIVPAGLEPGTEEGWGVVITESKDGHVSDKDAAGINYDTLMRDMQAATQEENGAREEAGFGTVNLVGWADQPRYDAATHKMYWAKELAFSDNPGEHTLNYAVRILGRDNVLELNAVASMGQLPQIKRDMAAVLSQVSFTPGARYEDFNPNTDQLATYGIAGLLGVAAAKKVGLLAAALLFLKKGWILIAAALGGLIRLRGRRARA